MTEKKKASVGYSREGERWEDIAFNQPVAPVGLKTHLVGQVNTAHLAVGPLLRWSADFLERRSESDEVNAEARLFEPIKSLLGGSDGREKEVSVGLIR